MRICAIFACMLLVACAKEEDFDERFDEAQSDLEARAQALEAELTAEPENAEKAEQ